MLDDHESTTDIPWFHWSSCVLDRVCNYFPFTRETEAGRRRATRTGFTRRRAASITFIFGGLDDAEEILHAPPFGFALGGLGTGHNGRCTCDWIGMAVSLGIAHVGA